MQRNRQRVDIFWDFESARVSSQISGYLIAKGVRELASSYGLVRSFRVYLDTVRQQHPNFPTLKRELYTSGISIMDCPGASNQEVVDKAILVDMLTLAMDEEPPHTILVVTGDQHLSYALAVLRLRGFKIILVYPTGTQECLLMQADESFNWHNRILGRNSDRNYQDDWSSSSSSPPPSIHSNASQNSYTAASIANGVHSSTGAHSVQAGSRFKPATSRSYNIESSPRLSFDTDARLHKADEGSVTDPTSAALSALPPPRTSPLLAGHRRSRPTHVNSSLNGSSCALPGTLKPNPRTRASTVSGGWFFPPPPSFPLDPPPADGPTLTLRDKTETRAVSPPSPESSTVLDRPNPEPDLGEALAGTRPTVTSGSTPPVREPAEDSSPVVTPTVPDVVLPAVDLPETSAPKSLTASTPSHTSNQAGLSVVSAPTPPVMPTTLHRVNGSNPIPTTARSRSAASSSHPAPVASSSGPTTTGLTTKSSSGPALSSSTLKINSGISVSSSTRSVPLKYRPLVQLLQQQHQNTWIEQSQLASKIIKLKPTVYADAGVSKWGKYVVNAVNAGIILKKGDLISLREEWLK